MPIEANTLAVMYLVMPLWIAAGFADWLCHRRSDIEHTAGHKESLIHILMFAEVGVPLLAALFLEVNAFIIALMIGAFFVHEATALWDVSYAVSQRHVSPFEQHMHSFLEMLPLLAIVLVSLSHLPQFLALFGLGDEAARTSLALKSPPLPAAYVITLLVCVVLFSLLPYLNELWRCLRARRVHP